MSAFGFGTGGGVLSIQKLDRAAKERIARREVRRWRVRNFFANRLGQIPLELYIALATSRLARKWIPGINCPHSRAYLKVWRGGLNMWVDYGYAGCHLKTTAGKQFVAGAYNNTNELELLKFHAFGTGTTAAAIGDTALGTEFTTQYNPDNTRPTGTQGVAGAVYTTVGTFTPDTNCSPSEWMLTTQAATGAGTCFDRVVFTAVPLSTATSDALQMTYAYTEA